MQTIPRKDEDDSGVAKSEVKKMFKSRFGDEGVMVELDYSQLEVIIQAILTDDKQLQQDIRDRVDFHCKRLAASLGEDYQHVWDMCHIEKDGAYKRGRTNAKKFSFQRAYGAGAGTISDDTGMPRDEVDALIAAEERLYPGVARFDEQLESAIKHNRFPTDKKLFIDGVIFTQGQSYWDSPTGTRYAWKEHVTPIFMHAKGKYTGFSPTERKNYPVQGFGGEIMETMLGVVFRELLQKDRNLVKLVNTVHDCIWLDCHKSAADDARATVQRIMESVPEVFNEAFPKLNITVPFPVESEIGPDMFHLS
jgi:DNA polymerase I-like protein with 3'-5' exonuclease and polymerase domains